MGAGKTNKDAMTGSITPIFRTLVGVRVDPASFLSKVEPNYLRLAAPREAEANSRTTATNAASNGE